jgi:hypothetical protein
MRRQEGTFDRLLVRAEQTAMNAHKLPTTCLSAVHEEIRTALMNCKEGTYPPELAVICKQVRGLRIPFPHHHGCEWMLENTRSRKIAIPPEKSFRAFTASERNRLPLRGGRIHLRYSAPLKAHAAEHQTRAPIGRGELFFLCFTLCHSHRKSHCYASWADRHVHSSLHRKREGRRVQSRACSMLFTTSLMDPRPGAAIFREKHCNISSEGVRMVMRVHLRKVHRALSDFSSSRPLP